MSEAKSELGEGALPLTAISWLCIAFGHPHRICFALARSQILPLPACGERGWPPSPRVTALTPHRATVLCECLYRKTVSTFADMR